MNTITTLAQDIQQAMNDWDAATPAQRREANDYAAQKAAKAQVEIRDRESREAMMFNAQHGNKGGEFKLEIWANGRVMVGPENARANQMIPYQAYETLKTNNWRFNA